MGDEGSSGALCKLDVQISWPRWLGGLGAYPRCTRSNVQGPGVVDKLAVDKSISPFRAHSLFRRCEISMT